MRIKIIMLSFLAVFAVCLQKANGEQNDLLETNVLLFIDKLMHDDQFMASSNALIADPAMEECLKKGIAGGLVKDVNDKIISNYNLTGEYIRYKYISSLKSNIARIAVAIFKPTSESRIVRIKDSIAKGEMVPSRKGESTTFVTMLVKQKDNAFNHFVLEYTVFAEGYSCITPMNCLVNGESSWLYLGFTLNAEHNYSLPQNEINGFIAFLQGELARSEAKIEKARANSEHKK